MKRSSFAIFLCLFLLFGGNSLHLYAQNNSLPHLPEKETLYFQSLFQAVEEPILDQTSSETLTLRFTLFRSLDPTIIFRLKPKDDGAFSLVTKQLNGERPPQDREGKFEVYDGLRYDSTENRFFKLYRPIANKEVKETRVTEEKVKALLILLEKDKFFDQVPLDAEDNGKNGSYWIMEAWLNGQYHFMARKSPREGWYRSLCMNFIEISGLEIEYLY